QLAWKIGVEPGRQQWFVRHRAGDQVVLERDLGVAQKYGQPRAGEPATSAAALLQLLVGRQGFEASLEQATLFEGMQQKGIVGKLAAATAFRPAQGQRLLVVCGGRGWRR